MYNNTETITNNWVLLHHNNSDQCKEKARFWSEIAIRFILNASLHLNPHNAESKPPFDQCMYM